MPIRGLSMIQQLRVNPAQAWVQIRDKMHGWPMYAQKHSEISECLESSEWKAQELLADNGRRLLSGTQSWEGKTGSETKFQVVSSGFIAFRQFLFWGAPSWMWMKEMLLTCHVGHSLSPFDLQKESNNTSFLNEFRYFCKELFGRLGSLTHYGGAIAQALT